MSVTTDTRFEFTSARSHPQGISSTSITVGRSKRTVYQHAAYEVAYSGHDSYSKSDAVDLWIVEVLFNDPSFLRGLEQYKKMLEEAKF